MNETRDFSNSPRSVTEARRFVVAVTRPLSTEVAEVAELIVSELATNAVRHARGGFSVRIETIPDQIRVEVSDADPGRPTPRSAGPLDPTGRGLLIVEALSQAWGVVTPPSGGKVVWFTLGLSHAPSGG